MICQIQIMPNLVSNPLLPNVGSNYKNIRNQMENINWIQVIIGFLSGGAFGAFIKQFFDNRRNRIQPIGKSIELKSFYDKADNRLIDAQIILKEDNLEYKFSKLYTGTIQILNSGLTDFQEFNFGITTSNSVKFVQIKSTSLDRHHLVNYSQKPALQSQLDVFDITLKPFNRKDIYTFDFLLTTSQTTITENDIQISSAHPIKWNKLVSTTEIIFEIANKTLVEIVAQRLLHFRF